MKQRAFFITVVDIAERRSYTGTNYSWNAAVKQLSKMVSEIAEHYHCSPQLYHTSLSLHEGERVSGRWRWSAPTTSIYAAIAREDFR